MRNKVYISEYFLNKTLTLNSFHALSSLYKKFRISIGSHLESLLGFTIQMKTNELKCNNINLTVTE